MPSPVSDAPMLQAGSLSASGIPSDSKGDKTSATGLKRPPDKIRKNSFWKILHC